jgi:hypothetical protein
MAFSAEQVVTASSAFNYLLKQKIVEKGNIHIQPYLEDAEIQEIVRILARQSGTQILEASQKIHLVAHAEGSVYANSFTQLKEKHHYIKTKNDLYLLHIILMVYLSEVDGDLLVRSHYEINGITFEKLEAVVAQTFEYWEKELDNDPNFESKWGISIRSVMELWASKALKDEDRERLVVSMKTRFNCIKAAVTLLEEEKLLRVINDEGTYIIYPLEDLFDRLTQLYHDHERFKVLKEFIQARKEDLHASNS